MAKYADKRQIRWYDISCPVCGKEQTNSWEKRVSRALGYQCIVCEDCISKEYGLTVGELMNELTRRLLAEGYGPEDTAHDA